jgi:undecaprenyl phosphate N,N'-diacetylbacillosamine 1-phosphate transferase
MCTGGLADQAEFDPWDLIINVYISGNPLSMSKPYTPYVKRGIDLFVSLALFALVSPFFVAITIVLYLTGDGKPFFFQRRPGLNGSPFTIWKFRTMADVTDADGNPLADAERLTPIGSFIRSLSLDELPQLINVIRGDMSLVGPRPLLEEYLSLYSDFEKRRHELRPGITGWAQVSGRNRLAWEEKFACDVWYVDHCSFVLDCRILGLTLLKVLQAEGIGSVTSPTMERFSESAR